MTDKPLLPSTSVPSLKAMEAQEQDLTRVDQQTVIPSERATAASHEAIRAGDVFDLSIRRVMVSGMPASAKVCRDRRGRIAVRNVETNRLSYVPERLLRGNPKVQSGATLNESDASDGTQQQRSVAVDLDLLVRLLTEILAELRQLTALARKETR